MGRVRTEKRDIVISRLNNLAERLSNEENTYENTPIKEYIYQGCHRRFGNIETPKYSAT